ncbi:MAG: hypothetical protein FVQ80_15070 [Planctomycetes bacterium]|nr:hypothetical protein [Planctomycetota bacterium]
MSLLLENLQLFNRKERFHLLATALPLQHSENLLDPAFAKQLEGLTGLTLPERVFLAIDYHLDWLYAALHTARMSHRASELRWSSATPLDNVFSRKVNGRQAIARSPRDIDLLLAYDDNGRVQILLIEAKFDTSWSNSQLREKAGHLANIFGPNENEWEDLAIPHFLVASPREPQRLDWDVLPNWARKHERWWIKISGAEVNSVSSESLVRVRCCDERGTDSIDGKRWKVV